MARVTATTKRRDELEELITQLGPKTMEENRTKERRRYKDRPEKYKKRDTTTTEMQIRGSGRDERDIKRLIDDEERLEQIEDDVPKPNDSAEKCG